VMLPQVGQGALAVECRVDDATTRRLLDAIDDVRTRLEVEAERDFLIELGGDCDLPAGAHAQLRPDGSISIVGLLAPAEPVDRPTRVERVALTARPADQPGRTVARRLRSRL
jgi:hydroxymethylbilane synthase